VNDFDFGRSHFALFGLPESYRLDMAALEGRYRELQSVYHPDRSASLPDAQKRQSLQIATQINQAFQTLKQPLSRARYLLQLRGVDTQEETNTAMPMDFLMAQMEWRERIADVKASRSIGDLEGLGRELAGEIKTLETELAMALDDKADLPAAASAVRKLKFLEKLDQEIGDAIEMLLD